MKKIISALLLICIAAFCLTSCQSASNFCENLDSSYYSETLDFDDIEYYFEYLETEVSPNNVTVAYLYTKSYSNIIFIVEFDKTSTAKSFASDEENILNKMNALDNSLTYNVVQKGKVVLLGTASGIEDALD